MECPGNLKAPMVKAWCEKGDINFWRAWISTTVFCPQHQWDLYKSCCGEASPIGDLPKWEDEACPIIAFCLIMSVLTCFSLVSILAYNTTRLSLSNEPFLLKRSCVFLIFIMCLHFRCCFMPTQSHSLLMKPLNQEFFIVFPKLCMISHVQKQKSYLCLSKQTSSGNSSDSLKR